MGLAVVVVVIMTFTMLLRVKVALKRTANYVMPYDVTMVQSVSWVKMDFPGALVSLTALWLELAQYVHLI